MNKILTYKEFEKIELKKINSIFINANLIFNKTHRANTTNNTITANNTINIQKPIHPINNYLDLIALKKIIEALYIIYVASINNIVIDYRYPIHNVNLKRDTLSYWVYEKHTKYKHIKLKIKGINYLSKNDNITLLKTCSSDEYNENQANKIQTYFLTLELYKNFYNHYSLYKENYENIMEYYNEFIKKGSYFIDYISIFTDKDVKDIMVYYYYKFLK